MTLEEQSRLSYYRRIAGISSHGNVELVQHVESGRVYVRKTQTVYDRRVYEILRGLRHPFFPRIEECVEDGEKLVIVEAYVSGETLQAALDRGETFSLKRTAEFMVQICDGLGVLHAQNPPIVHRDIKPSNLILTDDGELKMVDCNAARQFEENKTMDTVLIGTQGFAAPEQYGFRQTDPRTDIYSMGVLAQLLLTGRMPQEGRYEGRASAVIQKCMELDPANRYENLEQLRRAWKEIIREEEDGEGVKEESAKEESTREENEKREEAREESAKKESAGEESVKREGTGKENAKGNTEKETREESEKRTVKGTVGNKKPVGKDRRQRRSGKPCSLYRPLGFRTGSVWKMILSLFIYYQMIHFPLEVEFTSQGIPASGPDLWIDRAICWVTELGWVLFWGDFGGMQRKIPLMNKKRWLKWIMLAVYSLLWFFIVAVIFSLLEQIWVPV